MDKVKNVPAWIEKKTLDYANLGYPPSPDDPENDLNPSGVTLAYKCLLATSLEDVWVRAKKYFPELPFRGQIHLYEAISSSLPLDYMNYFTAGEAEAWKEKFLKNITEAIDLWKQCPPHYNALTAMPNFYEEVTMPDGKCLISDSIKTRHIAQMISRIESGAFMEIYQRAAENFQYTSRGFGGHVKGENAKRMYFVRDLSTSMKRMTGQWKRQTVAEITSAAFDCNYSSKEVLRAMDGYDPEIFPDNFWALPNEQWLKLIARAF